MDEAHLTRSPRFPRRPPEWSAWNEAARARPWTVGLEEEVLLLDPHGWSVANRAQDALEAAPRSLASRAAAETHACVLELLTEPSRTVGDAVTELAGLRQELDRTLRERLGLRAAVAGTHPCADRSEVVVSSAARYREVGDTMRVLVRREPTMALHVHVAVPDTAGAVRAIDGLGPWLPLVLALSANSPFWRAADSGFASIRVPLFSMFPRSGIPRRFGTYEAYVRVVDTLLRSGAIPEPGFLWWDARLRPGFGTVEVRIMDAQSRIADVAALAAVVQCLVRSCAQEVAPARAAEPEVVSENRFLASRDGMEAAFIDAGGRRRRARDELAGVLEDLHPVAAELGCVAELASVAALADDPGCERQRRLAARRGPEAILPRLGDEFAVPDRPATAGRGGRVR